MEIDTVLENLPKLQVSTIKENGNTTKKMGKEKKFTRTRWSHLKDSLKMT